MEKRKWPIIGMLAVLPPLAGCGVDIALRGVAQREETRDAIRAVLAERDALATALAIQRAERIADAAATTEIVYAAPVRK